MSGKIISPRADESKSPENEMRRDDESWSFEDVMGHIYKQNGERYLPLLPGRPGHNIHYRSSVNTEITVQYPGKTP